MTKKSRMLLAAAVVVAVLTTGAVFWVWKTPPSAIREQAETAWRVEEIRENFRRGVERGEAIVRETERKVVTVRERTVETVRRVSDDAVAGLLNAELVLWRMENGAAGVDDS